MSLAESFMKQAIGSPGEVHEGDDRTEKVIEGLGREAPAVIERDGAETRRAMQEAHKSIEESLTRV